MSTDITHSTQQAAGERAMGNLRISTRVDRSALDTLPPEPLRARADRLVDQGRVVLERMGLFFFFVPGVLAYAVDFATGTLYLPKVGRNGHFDIAAATAVTAGTERRDEAGICQAIRAHTGQQVSMRDPALRVRRAESTRWQRLREALDPAQLAAFTVGVPAAIR